VKATPPAAVPLGMTRYTLYSRCVGPVWTGATNVAFHRDLNCECEGEEEGGEIVQQNGCRVANRAVRVCGAARRGAAHISQSDSTLQSRDTSLTLIFDKA
jgi:hypothetical protein